MFKSQEYKLQKVFSRIVKVKGNMIGSETSSWHSYVRCVPDLIHCSSALVIAQHNHYSILAL